MDLLKLQEAVVQCTKDYLIALQEVIRQAEENGDEEARDTVNTYAVSRILTHYHLVAMDAEDDYTAAVLRSLCVLWADYESQKEMIQECAAHIADFAYDD